jgi:hypothetical protein
MAYGVFSRDEQGQIHLLEITLPMGYPGKLPSITAHCSKSPGLLATAHCTLPMRWPAPVVLGSWPRCLGRLRPGLGLPPYACRYFAQQQHLHRGACARVQRRDGVADLLL